MIDYGWLNVGSLLLGLMAWTLPLVVVFRDRVLGDRVRGIVPVVSLASCSAALVLQIAYQNYLARIEDWSAIMDTSGSLVFVSSVLLVVTVALNILVVARRNKLDALRSRR